MTHEPKTDRIERWVDLPVPAEQVWAVIGGFLSIVDWHPALESGELVDLEGELHRHVKTTYGTMILEKLIEQKPGLIRTSVVESDLPLENHVDTLTCFDLPEGGCRVFWSASFDSSSQQADQIIANIFEIGLEALQKRFGG